MAIIKRQSAASLLNEAIVLDLGDLQREAQRLRQRAQAEADAILAEARTRAAARSGELEAQAESILAEAREKGEAAGREAGMAAGLEEGRKQGRGEVLAELKPRAEQIVERFSAMVEQFDRQRGENESEAKRAVVQLALALAGRIVHRVIEVDPDVAADQVAAALGHVLRPTDVTLRVHPEDRRLLEALAPRLAESFAKVTHVAWQEDEQMARGGCVMTHGRGRVDASIETQLKRIAAMLAPGAEIESTGGDEDDTHDARGAMGGDEHGDR